MLERFSFLPIILIIDYVSCPEINLTKSIKVHHQFFGHCKPHNKANYEMVISIVQPLPAPSETVEKWELGAKTCSL